MGTSNVNSLFVFGHFVDLVENRTNFRTYEIFIFILLGASGGLIGTLFNYINRRVAMYHAKNTTTQTKRTIHLLGFTFVMACISFLLPLCWQVCTRLPTDEETKNWTVQEIDSLSDLVRFQCHEGYYNQMASLYFCPFDASMRHLFHFREYKGSTNPTFSAAPLILFFLTYFFMAACSAGLKVPMGMFVPSLLAGAAYGRLWGHVLNSAWPGYVADSGTYALMGAAAINGGVTRMTLSMTIIMLETAGNMTYLLPLMVTFGAARYSGNALSDGLYDIGMYLKDLPFLNSSLHTLGLLNFNSVTEIMAIPPVTFNEVSRVHTVYEALKNTTHNGFPILDNKGRLKGLMLRKTLCTLLDLKVFSVPLTKTQHRQRSMSINNKNSALEKEAAEMAAEGKVAIHLAPAGTVFYDRLEKSYPNFPDISRIELTQEQMVCS
jgi:chloride channel 7